MKSDIEIAESAVLRPIGEIAEKLGIDRERLYPYGNYIAKVEPSDKDEKKCGKLILVTAIHPTKSGEGKTTVSIGLADALSRLGKKTALALREPSLGPVFGIKGGACGGGYSQVAPMTEINLEFTGDFNAIEKANNLLASAIDNCIFYGTEHGIDPERVVFKRCMDMNDRALRNIKLKVGSGDKGYERGEGFNITAASEIMAILCLATDFADLKSRIGRIVAAFDRNGGIVTCADLNCDSAMAILLRNAVKPNLVQTLEGTPALIHGGPFANIAHGCNSIAATSEALRRADYVVTEAGFGADLGAEKFLDIKCRVGGFRTACAVVVATVKALKLNGGGEIESGIKNLSRHIENLKNVFSLPVVVALNRFDTDTDGELLRVTEACAHAGAKLCLTEVFAKGGAGGVTLAECVLHEIESNRKKQSYCYEFDESYAEKLEKIAFKIYRAERVEWSETAKKRVKEIEDAGYAGLPVCVAKTQYSFSDDPELLGAPTGFTFRINDIELRAGAGFVVALSGNMILMPALARMPNYLKMSISDDGKVIRGLD